MSPARELCDVHCSGFHHMPDTLLMLLLIQRRREQRFASTSTRHYEMHTSLSNRFERKQERGPPPYHSARETNALELFLRILIRFSGACCTLLAEFAPCTICYYCQASLTSTRLPRRELCIFFQKSALLIRWVHFLTHQSRLVSGCQSLLYRALELYYASLLFRYRIPALSVREDLPASRSSRSFCPFLLSSLIVQ